MSMRLLYITNNPSVGQIAQRAGVDWIFVDLEHYGKKDRQAQRDTVISAHTVDDVRAMREVIDQSRLLVRVNPIGEWSAREIDNVISAGADIIMLPFFQNRKQVVEFIGLVKGRVETCLLLETLEAIEALDEILEINGIDYFHIGLNDIHIARKTTFMFEFLADGGVDKIARKFRKAGMIFGFGGMAQIGSLRPPAECILAEHYRLGSTGVILSRSFCDPADIGSLSDFEERFCSSVKKIRVEEAFISKQPDDFFEKNRHRVIKDIQDVVSLKSKNVV